MTTLVYLLDFTESFCANVCCRFCKSSREEIQKHVTECKDVMRNSSNYYSDIRCSNVSLSGIKAKCIWNRIKSYHVTENFYADIAHDIFESIGAFDAAELLYQFTVIDKLYTLETLNTKLKYFNFNGHNRPPLLTAENLKKKLQCLVQK